MPSRKSVAKICELASRSLKDTAPASLKRFSDMGTPHTKPNIARLGSQVQRPTQASSRHSFRPTAAARPRSTKKEPPLPAAQGDNREASNRVDRSHSMSRSGQYP